MKTITIEDLGNRLQEVKHEYIKITIAGSISMSMIGTLDIIIITEDFMLLADDIKEMIRINIHQIKKIEMLSKGLFLITLDEPQKIIISYN